MENMMRMKRAIGCTTALSLALALSTAYGADTTTSAADASTTTQSQPMTGKEKATAIGAGTGAVAGAVVGGPVGALVGAGIGGYVGHQGTDANGHVNTHGSTTPTADNTVRKAQVALNGQGYNVGTVDGRFGPNTESAVRRFQAKNGLSETGTLDTPTLTALGISG
jgi:peptidoglycan hydrolase-like protein with peptidoglycan-binding domain